MSCTCLRLSLIASALFLGPADISDTRRNWYISATVLSPGIRRPKHLKSYEAVVYTLGVLYRFIAIIDYTNM